jgi:hypothetical protein
MDKYIGFDIDCKKTAASLRFGGVAGFFGRRFLVHFGL